MQLASDGHVHTEWSLDTGGPGCSADGQMEAMCQRAVGIGLPALAFTDHLDFTGWSVEPEDLLEHLRPLVDDTGVFRPKLLDVSGYLDGVDRCRAQFPDLAILSGVELGQPHLDEARARAVVDLSALNRVNGSLHTLPVTDAPGGVRSEPVTLYRSWPPERVIREYLAEVPRTVAGSDSFAVFTHLDYPVRSWPAEAAGPFNPRNFEEEFRHAMRALAGTGRALELNVGSQLRPWLPHWWAEEGGRAITFGSDAHVPGALAANFPEAMVMAEHAGFRPGRHPADFWIR